jgi:hypothetical protein
MPQHVGSRVKLHLFIEHSPRSSGSRIPFTPLSGSEFEALACKEYGGEQRVCFLDKKGRQCEIPLSWTDLAVEDPLTLLAGWRFTLQSW